LKRNLLLKRKIPLARKDRLFRGCGILERGIHPVKAEKTCLSGA
jgi:hypothetical protein